MIHSERILRLMAEKGLSQTALARRVGVTQGAIAKIAGSNPGGSRYLHIIARELGTTAAYLTGETDDPSEGAVPAPTVQDIAEHLDLVEVVSIDANYGMGGTFLGSEVEEKVLHFPRAFIESITLSPPASLTWARGRGDSMFPTIGDGDLVLIDRSNRTPREQDALWALTVGEMAMIKRLRVRGETVTILSDNDRVPPDQAHADEVNIVGRVIFVGRRT
ncbi:S24 family peptidase [uncultured Sphingomonas sp.]|uniref:XRE family transcriptional regulator n=1 Tax=uncultured Sphingomonas sp. TaxID=158754 RepID=UPI0025F660DD|nr:S24 family peptidase [uncultured Sphingomonas sp.]